jgi:4-hydroxy-tetrahydrodipicolinate synthase
MALIKNQESFCGFLVGLHTFYSEKNKIYKNILPPLSLLSDIEKKDLKENLSNLNFSLSTSMAA